MILTFSNIRFEVVDNIVFCRFLSLSESKGLYLDSYPNDLPHYIHPIISQACGIDPKLNELVKDLITCIKEEELIPWTDSLKDIEVGNQI